MGVEESSIFKRLCSRRRINVGCLGTRILRLPLPWPGTRTQIGLAENGQKGKVRQKIKWHEPDLSSRAAANGSKSHPRCEKKRIPHSCRGLGKGRGPGRNIHPWKGRRCKGANAIALRLQPR